MDDLVAEFIAETNESLGQIDNDLIALEQNPNDKNIIGNLFRLVHTIKGTCGFLGLGRLEKLAHHGENVMGRFRDGDLEVKQEYVSLILEAVDQIKVLIAALEANGAEPEGNDADLIARLDAVYEGRDPVATAPQAEDQTQNNDMAGDGAVDIESLSREPNPNNEGGLSDYDIAVLQAAFDSVPSPAFVEIEPQKEQSVAEKPATASTPTTPATDDESKQVAASSAVQSLRVNVDVLENLMTMVSELVLTRNQLLQIMRHSKDSDFDTPLQRLNHVVSDLQEGVMKTRMQPVGNAWAKLPRIIRDISIDLNKKIDLQMEGQETELDRQVLDLIKDPLTHMVRNSADHGIETPEDRLAAGKPETGTIVLNAFHEGGHIIMQIKDDGKGLNTARIREKALEKGLATAEELNAMTPKQINQFIFAPGFSTAAAVTAVSGRGVGMDVVRTNIEKIGGTIDLESVEGQGTTVSIKIPLTLAIVSALIVESAGDRFAIPQLAVQELVMASSNGDNRIEMIKGSPIYRLRDQLLPLVYLDDLLGISKDNDLEGQKAEAANDNAFIVVTKVGAYSFGIVVDRVYDTEEIVVKPVAKILNNIELFSGNTILGDGTVIMILDPGGIARSTGDITVSDTAEKTAEATVRHDKKKTSLILFAGMDGTPKAVPLQLVSRLENIDLSKIEQSNDQMVIQYRGSLMPLIPFDPDMSIDKQGQKPVLVFTDGDRSMGLIVSTIIDILEDHIHVKMTSNREDTLGSAIIRDKATGIINVGYYIGKAYDDWFDDHGDVNYQTDTEAMRSVKSVMIVDDSPFFRNMLAPILSVAGYHVIVAETAIEAMELLEGGEAVDVIISDIEMPSVDGFEFAQQIRNSRWSSVPMIALTSHNTAADREKGKEVGFNDYVAKFDRETLLAALSDTLNQATKLDRKEEVA